MFRAVCALLGVAGLVRSQCVGPNINVQLPEPYNYEVGTTPDWVITPAVKCGIVQDGFTWGSDPTVAVADAETADLTFTWCWGDCTGGPSQANYVLSHYLASTDKATNSTFHSELSCDLPSSGSVPSSSTSFDVSVVCGADFLGTIVMSFLFVDASTGATTLIEFVVRYQCYTPGCSTLCYEHGDCDVLRGLCKCNSGWLTDDCALYVTYPKELCSLQHFNVSYIIPADFNGVNGLGFQIYFTLIRSFITAERRNFATWTTAVPINFLYMTMRPVEWQTTAVLILPAMDMALAISTVHVSAMKVILDQTARVDVPQTQHTQPPRVQFKVTIHGMDKIRQWNINIRPLASGTLMSADLTMLLSLQYNTYRWEMIL
ncbi:hypothetical protein Pelo_18071 [Pelomyxa schiedti]|nr:hypothetical protein Pelo_18071 [Pelomyxa schiedti]